MVASPHATAEDIALHVETARTLHAYAGLLGAVLEGIESLRSLTGSRQTPEQGSARLGGQARVREVEQHHPCPPRERLEAPRSTRRARSISRATWRTCGVSSKTPSGSSPGSTPTPPRAGSSPRRAQSSAGQPTGIRSSAARSPPSRSPATARRRHTSCPPARRMKIRRRVTPSRETGRGAGANVHSASADRTLGADAGGHSSTATAGTSSRPPAPRDQCRPPQQHPRAARQPTLHPSPGMSTGRMGTAGSSGTMGYRPTRPNALSPRAGSRCEARTASSSTRPETCGPRLPTASGRPWRRNLRSRNATRSSKPSWSARALPHRTSSGRSCGAGERR